ncbi:DUF6320 domain-containing protein [Corticicoccus populi]|uniref:DUF6320 domain-containing protein n=1 Tax=Corticicoccus populi TaxID=1812821 RepID=A0ABW5WZG7_9STAP
MNKCPNCDVQVSQSTCPLCYTQLDTEERQYEWYPDYNSEEQRIRTRISRLSILAGSLAVLICLMINIIILPQFLWVFYVAASVFYVMVSISHTILSGSHIGGKITIQVISLTILLLVIDAMSGNLQWSVDYAVPFLIIAGILLISIIILRVPLKWTGYFSFLLMMIGMGFIPIILYVSQVSHVLWPSLTAALFAVTVFSVFLLFAKSFMTQLSRRFHI